MFFHLFLFRSHLLFSLPLLPLLLLPLPLLSPPPFALSLSLSLALSLSLSLVLQTNLFVGMTEMQREVYKLVLRREVDVLSQATGSGGKNKLSNILMQLRKACNHPYLFEGVEDRGLNPMGEHLIQNCGKLQLLDKLLTRLQEEGSRVLIFSQMTRILDILEDYCTIRGFEMCRIDGSTSGDDRDDGVFNQIYLFFSASLLF